MRDGSLQSSEGGDGAKGKDQNHRLSQGAATGGGEETRVRDRGVMRQTEKGKALHRGQWCPSSKWSLIHHPVPSAPSSAQRVPWSHWEGGLGHKESALPKAHWPSASFPRGCPHPGEDDLTCGLLLATKGKASK